MAKRRERYIGNVKCRRKDGTIVYYAIYDRNGFEIEGPLLEWHRCQPSVQNVESAKIEIAQVYGVEVLS